MNRRLLLKHSWVPILFFTPGCIDGNHTENNERGDDSENTAREPRLDSIFIENTTGSSVIVELHVEQKEEETVLLDEKYDVPSKIGLEISNIGTVGSEYVVTAKSNGLIEEKTWTILSCAQDEGTPIPGDNTDLGVEIMETDLLIASNDCDGVRAGYILELTYKPAESYVIEDS